MVFEVVEVCVYYGGMYVCHVCFDLCVVYGVMICVDVCVLLVVLACSGCVGGFLFYLCSFIGSM